jgi:hypothetical protein
MLYSKVIRVLKDYIKQVLIIGIMVTHAQGGGEEEYKFQIEKIVSKVLLPTLSMTPMNPGAANEIWGIIQLFPYTTRYSLRLLRLMRLDIVCMENGEPRTQNSQI